MGDVSHSGENSVNRPLSGTLTSSSVDEAMAPIPTVFGLLRSARLVFPLSLLLTAVLTGCGVTLYGLFNGGLGPVSVGLLALACLLALLGLLLAAFQLKRQLLKPLVTLGASVAQVSQGEPGATPAGYGHRGAQRHGAGHRQHQRGADGALRGHGQPHRPPHQPAWRRRPHR